MFAITPKYDCPHEASIDTESVLQFLASELTNQINEPCPMCFDLNKKDDSQFKTNGTPDSPSGIENWICLGCKSIFCSRYVNSHMYHHYEEMKGNGSSDHCIGMSFTDGSFWCYECDSYIYSSQLQKISHCFGVLKHPTKNCTLPAIGEDEEELNDEYIEKSGEGNEIEKVSIDEKFSFQQFIDGLISKRFHKICFLTGAGISVAAGIPDFRSPEVGLYAKIRDLNIPALPQPELLFNIDTFRAQPDLFYSLTSYMLFSTAKPVKAHHFVKKCADEQMLLMNYTQNVDSLELDAGLDPSLLIQAHGHMRTAHCIECREEYPMKQVLEVVERKEVPYCDKCTAVGKTSVVKPDVIFFGEKLPSSFFHHFEDIKQADLVIVMGTSLKVIPFSLLLTFVPAHVPVVLINRDNSGGGGLDQREQFLFLQGDIEDIVADIMTKVGWD